MPRRLLHVLLTFVFALAMMLPVSVRAMPMSSAMTVVVVQQHCPNCPHPTRTDMNHHMMPACHASACAGAVAALSGPALLPGRVLLRSTYPVAPPVRWTATAHAPDPFPPRSIALV